MQPLAYSAEVRQKILLQKEIPPLPQIAQRILSLSPDAEVGELARIIEQSPEIAARLIGMANAAYFGWPGGVWTIHDAIYKVLGIKLVKSLAIGMAMGTSFDVGKCRGFRPEQYWFTAVVTAQLAQGLFPSLPYAMRYELENLHMDGLLHNLGIAVLAHLFPQELSRALRMQPGDEAAPTTERIRSCLGVDQMQAGSWLARKWHLPRNIVLTMEHHKEPGYRGDFWPTVQLVAYCERQAQRLYSTGNMEIEPGMAALLGLKEDAADKICLAIEGQLEEIKAMVSLMAGGE